MKLIIILLTAIGLLTVFVVVFCSGMAYEGQLIEKAAQEGRPFRTPGGGIYRVTPWEDAP